MEITFRISLEITLTGGSRRSNRELIVTPHQPHLIPALTSDMGQVPCLASVFLAYWQQLIFILID